MSDTSRLRDVLAEAGYTADRVSALLGPVAHAALGRGDLVPALRATTGGSPLETAVRLFLLGTREPRAACAAALGDVDAAEALGLVEYAEEGLWRAALDLRPYDDFLVVSDLGAEVRPGPLWPDHVLGVGPASTTLAGATVRPPVGTALDVGTGCGVQALHLSRHAAAVTATDRNPRALELARLTADLNGIDVELVEGDLLDPVRGRRFDLVVSNPPFVAGPPGGAYLYRDSGLAGDEVCARLVREAPSVLADGGWCQLLANWLYVRGQDWRERVAGWLAGTGCDAWVVERDVQDPAEYAALWLRDAGETDRARHEAWLGWFDENDVEGVGFGLVTMRRSGRGDPVQVVEAARQRADAVLGPYVEAWFHRQDALRDHADLTAMTLAPAPDLRLVQEAVAGAGGWSVASQTLRLDGGFRWEASVDQALVELVAGCDGSRRLGDVLDVLVAAYGFDASAALPAVRELVARGFLVPA